MPGRYSWYLAIPCASLRAKLLSGLNLRHFGFAGLPRNSQGVAARRASLTQFRIRPAGSGARTLRGPVLADRGRTSASGSAQHGSQAKRTFATITLDSLVAASREAADMELTRTQKTVLPLGVAAHGCEIDICTALRSCARFAG